MWAKLQYTSRDDKHNLQREYKRGFTLVPKIQCVRRLVILSAMYKETDGWVFAQGLCQAALLQSPCPLSSTPDCPALPTLEGAEAALRLLTTACMPLHHRWLINSYLSLSRRLLHQKQSQGELTAPIIQRNERGLIGLRDGIL